MQAVSPLVETGSSSTGDTVARAEVASMPLLDRNYLGLLQLVPGVAINRAGSGDAAAPVLGERANNTYFLVDGMPNRDEIDGGDAVPFSLDAILEMQVLTSGYRAEFGRGSGGVVNAATKSGTNAWRGSTSLFHRDSALDSADVPDSAVPFLRRWNASATIGGPLVKDRMFLFGAAERIRETRQSNFQYRQISPRRCSALKHQSTGPKTSTRAAASERSTKFSDTIASPRRSASRTHISLTKAVSRPHGPVRLGGA